VAFLNKPPCALSISFHFIEESNYENSLFSPMPQVTNSHFKIKRKRQAEPSITFGPVILIVPCVMIQSLSYCEDAEDFETKHSMLCSKYINEMLVQVTKGHYTM
jgi:hypothetical protein